MKKLNQLNFSRHLHHPLVLLSFLLLFTAQLKAQPSWPATSPIRTDSIVTGTQPDTNEWVNIDMFNKFKLGTQLLQPTSNIIVTVYDDITNGYVHVVVYDMAKDQFRSVDIPNAKHPDVALLDDPNNAGVDYYAAVVYETNTNRVNVEYIHILNTWPAASPLNCTTAASVTLPVTTTGNTQTKPHIDAAPDPNHTTLGSVAGVYDLVGMYRYVIAWTETDILVNSEIRTATDDFYVNGTSPSFTTETIADGTMSDVALQWMYGSPITNGSYEAYYIYYEPNTQNVYRADWDLSGTPNTYSPIDNGIVDPDVCPRIEAMNAVAASPGPTFWQGICEIDKGNGYVEIHSYDETGINVNTVNYSDPTYMPSNPLTNWDCFSPTVAAGCDLGWTAGTYDGNNEYSVGWFLNDGDNMILSLAQMNADVSSILRGYEQVNTLGFDPPPVVAIAMTYGSNAGSGFAAAWFDGTDIRFKKCGDQLHSFKPTDVITLPLSGKAKIYPNPAIEKIHISNMANGQYNITDITGRTLLSGEFDGTIDVSSLSNGVYVLHASHDGKLINDRFVKQ